MLFRSNLDSLRSSANDCDLCSLVLSAIEKAIVELQNPREEVLALRRPAQPTWNLWLAKRDLGDGFWVFSDCADSKNIDFVAAVGFCAEDSKSPLHDRNTAAQFSRRSSRVGIPRPTDSAISRQRKTNGFHEEVGR